MLASHFESVCSAGKSPRQSLQGFNKVSSLFVSKSTIIIISFHYHIQFNETVNTESVQDEASSSIPKARRSLDFGSFSQGTVSRVAETIHGPCFLFCHET